MLIGMGNPIQTIPISAAALREVDLIGVFRYANTYPEGITIIQKIPEISKLITHRYVGLEKVQKAFELAGRTVDEKGKLVLKVVVELGTGKSKL